MKVKFGRKKKGKRKCAICGKPFRRQGGGNRKTCGIICQALLIQKRNREYMRKYRALNYTKEIEAGQGYV